MSKISTLHRLLAWPLAIGITLGAATEFCLPVYAVDNEEQTNIRVYEKASTAVVSIQAGSAVGSGSIISADGLILTNAHVVEAVPGQSVKVSLADRRQFNGQVVGFANNGLDLALIKLEGVQDLPTMKIANGKARVGQRAFAIGNPFGKFQGTFTTGIVSRVDTKEGLIQTDAAINPGNSGGPLLNSDGELIGVNTAIYASGQNPGNIGIGFAIAIDRVQPFLTAYRQGKVNSTLAQNSAVTRRPQKKIRVQQLPLTGQVISARLGSGDPVLPTSNSYVNIYVFRGIAGQQIRIEISSREIDPGLILLSPKGKLIAEAQGNGRNVVGLRGRLPVTGNYLVLANAIGRRGSGSYKIRAVGAR
jgi:S1-C subfamily serine protease